eukprot:TCONS_00024113-protein
MAFLRFNVHRKGRPTDREKLNEYLASKKKHTVTNYYSNKNDDSNKENDKYSFPGNKNSEVEITYIKPSTKECGIQVNPEDVTSKKLLQNQFTQTEPDTKLMGLKIDNSKLQIQLRNKERRLSELKSMVDHAYAEDIYLIISLYITRI